MKKKKFLVGICFITLLCILDSCNSNEKKITVPEPVPGDTIVTIPNGPQNPQIPQMPQTPGGSWTTNSDLILGTIQVDLKIDGVSTTTESGKITIRPKSDFSAIEVNCPNGQFTYKPGWHGMGDYDKGYAEWYEIIQGHAGSRFSSDYNAPGTMKITEWADGKVSGTFSVTVIENNTPVTPKKKLLEGAFHYLHDR